MEQLIEDLQKAVRLDYFYKSEESNDNEGYILLFESINDLSNAISSLYSVTHSNPLLGKTISIRIALKRNVCVLQFNFGTEFYDLPINNFDFDTILESDKSSSAYRILWFGLKDNYFENKPPVFSENPYRFTISLYRA